MKLSIIIPAYKEQHLQKTINSLLAQAKGEIEVIAVLDGYWASPELEADPRVHILHFGANRGLRAAINAGVALAKGDYVMKTDAHCMFGPGYDVALLEQIEDDWVVIPRRYELDTEKWEVMPDPPVDYAKLVILESRNKFHGQEWPSRTRERAHYPIDETMSFQGSCWVMSRKWWDNVIKDLQEAGYGPFVQEPTEIGMQTYQAGGKVMVNKNAWYAHKHRDFNRTHHVKREDADAGNAYALERWKPFYQELRKRFNV